MFLDDINIKEIGKIKSYKKGSVIFNENDQCNALGIILKGSIKVVTTTLLNEEFTINILKENDMFGENLIFSKDPTFKGDLICLKSTDILFINKKDLLTLLRTDEKILSSFLSSLSLDRLNTQVRLKVLSQGSIRGKILFLIKRRMNQDKVFYYSTKEELSRYLAVPRPSLSRELINMERDGLVEVGKHYIKLKG